MAKRINTFAALQQVTSAFLNSAQDLVAGSETATQNNTLSAQADGIDCRVWSKSGGALATATLVLLDDSIDWRDRVVCGWYADAGAATDQLGGATDYNFRNSFLTKSWFLGYTGLQALSNVATGAAVSNGAGPVFGSGAGGSSWIVEAAANVTLYTQSDGKLYMYNSTGANIFPFVFVIALADAGLR